MLDHHSWLTLYPDSLGVSRPSGADSLGDTHTGCADSHHLLSDHCRLSEEGGAVLHEMPHGTFLVPSHQRAEARFQGAVQKGMQMSGERLPRLLVLLPRHWCRTCPMSLCSESPPTSVLLWMTPTLSPSSSSLASSPKFHPAPHPLNTFRLHLYSDPCRPHVFEGRVVNRRRQGIGTSPGPPSLSRFSRAFSAGAVAPNLIDRSVCGSRKTAITACGRETSPCTPRVPPGTTAAVNGPESTPRVIAPRPLLLQKQPLQ